MSDGHSNVNRRDTIPSAVQLRLGGSVVVVFGIGTWIDWNELNGIASDPHNSTVFVVGSYTQLPSLVDRIRQAICDGQLLHCIGCVELHFRFFIQ